MTTRLSLTQWQRVEIQAKEAVKSSLVVPRVEDYMQRQIGRYPARLTAGVVILLAVVIVGAFVISAGKQIVAYDSVLGHLATSARLSPAWVSLALVAGILLSEVGSILFSFAAALFGAGVHRTIFRVFAVLCAVLAILANVAVTANVAYESALLGMLAWFVCLFVPAVVLAGALVAERLLIEMLDKRAAASVDFEIARREYARYMGAPETHPTYPAFLRRQWLEAYRRLWRDNAGQLDNPDTVGELWALDAGRFMPNFTTPAALPGAEQPSLTAGPVNS